MTSPLMKKYSTVTSKDGQSTNSYDLSSSYLINYETVHFISCQQILFMITTRRANLFSSSIYSLRMLQNNNKCYVKVEKWIKLNTLK